jgi:hypothetical protein
VDLGLITYEIADVPSDDEHAELPFGAVTLLESGAVADYLR